MTLKILHKPENKRSGDYSLFLVQLWQSDATRPGMYLKTSTRDWSAALEKHLGGGYKR